MLKRGMKKAGIKQSWLLFLAIAFAFFYVADPSFLLEDLDNPSEVIYVLSTYSTTTICTPSCAGKSCGASDGCGGLCTVQTCTLGRTCVAGVCQCPTGTTWVGDGCEATCSPACTSPAVCYQGSCCTPSCPLADKYTCGATVPSSCGVSCGLGTKCTAPQVCYIDSCCTPSCPAASTIACGTTDTRSNNCGGNCNVAGTYCQQGINANYCVSGACRQCIDNSVCGGGTYCLIPGNYCACPSNIPNWCEPNGCTNLQTDNNNCGVCGRVCGTGTTCSAGSCVSTCVPETNSAFCSRLGKNCGSVTASDNCGTSRTVNCGTCTSPQTCGGGGTANVCGCTPTTCAAQGKNCGTIPNGCGGTLNCGSCTSPQTCSSNVCTTPTCCCDSVTGIRSGNFVCEFDEYACSCTSTTTTSQIVCSNPTPNLCGSTCVNFLTDNNNCGGCNIVCNTFNPGYVCITGTCQLPAPSSTPSTICTAETNTAFCTRLGKNCGLVTASDNCGTSRTVNCGSCSSTEMCVSNVCTPDCRVTGCLYDQVCGDFDNDGTYQCSCPTGIQGYGYLGYCPEGGTICTDLTTTSNCGACSKSCLSGEICAGSGAYNNYYCSCPSPKTRCPAINPTVCTDTSSDKNNCGACNNKCGTGINEGMPICSNSRCVECVANGNCNVGAGEECINNICRLPLPTCQEQGGWCASRTPSVLNADWDNVASDCTFDELIVCWTCTQGYTKCSSTACYDLQNDRNNCNACGRSCPSLDPNKPHCVAGNCVQCLSNTDCGGGTYCDLTAGSSTKNTCLCPVNQQWCGDPPIGCRTIATDPTYCGASCTNCATKASDDDTDPTNSLDLFGTLKDYINSCVSGSCSYNTISDSCSGYHIVVQYSVSGSSYTSTVSPCGVDGGTNYCSGGVCLSCPVGEVFVDAEGRCKPEPQCTAGEERCSSTNEATAISREKCKADGSGWEAMTSCPDTIGICGGVTCTVTGTGSSARASCGTYQYSDGDTCQVSGTSGHCCSGVCDTTPSAANENGFCNACSGASYYGACSTTPDQWGYTLSCSGNHCCYNGWNWDSGEGTCVPPGGADQCKWTDENYDTYSPVSDDGSSCCLQNVIPTVKEAFGTHGISTQQNSPRCYQY